MYKLPNPLEINFGEGKIGIRRYTDNNGKFGLILTDTQKVHEIGFTDGKPEDTHEPQKGEVYLSFQNNRSLSVIIEELQKLK